MRRRQFIMGVGALGALGMPSGEAEAGEGLTRQLVDESLRLGTGFMLASQRRAGNFEYALDWHRMTYSKEDSAVRQAGAAWGLALIHHEDRRPRVRKALGRALRFFAARLKSHDGRRHVVYPGTDEGALGTVALVALAHIELLRVEPDEHLRARLDGYLKFLLHARRSEGGFHGAYDHEDGEPHGPPSSYYDGEALLALVKAARYLDMPSLLDAALAEADASYQRNVVDALESDPDSKVTKGYYQWSSMAWYELATRKKRLDKKHARRILRLADWMLDVHGLEGRARNTAYAYEGIIPAHVVATRIGDTERAGKYARAIEQGLRRLTSWQVGSPVANEHIRARGEPSERALGGVQNHRREPLLRIDVAQHQMHALMLARRHYPLEEPSRKEPQ